MRREYIIVTVSVVIGFVITFLSLFFQLYPTVKRSMGILDRSCEKYNVTPQKGFYYTLNHKTGEIIVWKKPEEK